MLKPSCEELLDLEPITVESDTSWRHGEYRTEVYKLDDKFWMAQYELSNDGETNALREGWADIQQCWPVAVTKIQYTTTNPE